MKKLLFGIFICFGLIFVMSHNANASDISINVVNPYRHTIGQVECAVQNGTITVATGNTCVWGPNVGGVLQGRGFSFIATHTKFRVWHSAVYEVYVDVGLTTNAELMVPAVWDSFNDTGNFELISFEKVSNDNNIGSSATYEGYVSTYRFVIRPKPAYADIGIEIGDNTRSNNWLYLVGDNWPVVIDTRITSITRYDIAGQPSNSDIVEAINELKESQEAKDAKEEQAVENIENQTPPSQNETGDGAAATNLIGAFSGFVSALGGLSATNCNLTLNFPSFAGGTRVVNVCQNKDKAGNIISVFSSLTLIIFYVPLAIRLLTMIYNEIRSFTNG